MSNELNQKNKEAVWDFWQKLNHVGIEHIPQTVRAAVHDDVDWNVSAPIDQLLGADNAITGFWTPLFHAFPDLKRAPYVFMGGIDASSDLYATVGGEEVGQQLRLSERQLRARLARHSPPRAGRRISGLVSSTSCAKAKSPKLICSLTSWR